MLAVERVPAAWLHRARVACLAAALLVFLYTAHRYAAMSSAGERDASPPPLQVRWGRSADRRAPASRRSPTLFRPARARRTTDSILTRRRGSTTRSGCEPPPTPASCRRRSVRAAAHMLHQPIVSAGIKSDDSRPNLMSRKQQLRVLLVGIPGAGIAQLKHLVELASGLAVRHPRAACSPHIRRRSSSWTCACRAPRPSPAPALCSGTTTPSASPRCADGCVACADGNCLNACCAGGGLRRCAPLQRRVGRSRRVRVCLSVLRRTSRHCRPNSAHRLHAAHCRACAQPH